MKKRTDKYIRKIVEEVIQKDHSPDETYNCPECEGTLIITLEGYSRRGKDMLGVQLRCNKCKFAKAIDLAKPIPI